MATRKRPVADLDSDERARAMQRRLLSATEWIESCELPIDKTPWFDYRQSLRAVANQPGWPHDVVWPKPPRG